MPGDAIVGDVQRLQCMVDFEHLGQGQWPLVAEPIPGNVQLHNGVIGLRLQRYHVTEDSKLSIFGKFGIIVV